MSFFSPGGVSLSYVVITAFFKLFSGFLDSFFYKILIAIIKTFLRKIFDYFLPLMFCFVLFFVSSLKTSPFFLSSSLPF